MKLFTGLFWPRVIFALHMRKLFHPVSNLPMQTQLGYVQVLKKKKEKFTQLNSPSDDAGKRGKN